MSKRVFAGAVALVITVLLMACSGAAENEAPEVGADKQLEQEASKPTTVPTHTPTPSPTPAYYPWEQGEPEIVSCDEADYYMTDSVHGIAASVGVSTKTLSDRTSKGVLLSTGSWENVFLTSGYDEAYPELNRAIRANNSATVESISAEYQQTLGYAKADEKSESVYFIGPYYTEQDNVIIRSDTRVFSILERTTTFYGGLHPSTKYIGITFDSETGSLLSIDDILTPFLAADKEPLADYIESVLVEDFPELGFTAGTGFILSHLNEEGFSWVLSNEGLEFIFNEFELLAPYAMGDQRVVIPFAGHENWFNENYSTVPGSWTTLPDQEGRVLCDIDGDGKTDYLTVVSIWDEYYSITALDVYVSDEYYYEGDIDKTRFEIYEWDPKPVFVHMEDGSSYLYVDVTGDDDRHMTYVYQITKEGAFKVGDVDGYIYSAKGDGAYSCERTVFDPEHFRLVTEHDLLGITYETNVYHIGKDGLPVRECDFYQIEGDYRVSLAKPMSFYPIDEEGHVQGDEMILETGEDIMFVRSNLRTKYDFTTATGSYIRLYIGLYEGEDIEEYFEGLNNAG